MSEYTITDKVERFDLFSFGMDTIMKHKTILSIPKPYMNLQWQIPHRSWTFQSQSPYHQNNPSYSHCPCPTFSPAHVIVSAAVAVSIVVVLDGVLCEEIGKEPPYKAYIFVYIVNYPKRSHCWEQAATQQHLCMSVILDWSQHSGWVGLGFLPQNAFVADMDSYKYIAFIWSTSKHDFLQHKWSDTNVVLLLCFLTKAVLVAFSIYLDYLE